MSQQWVLEYLNLSSKIWSAVKWRLVSRHWCSTGGAL